MHTSPSITKAYIDATVAERLRGAERRGHRAPARRTTPMVQSLRARVSRVTRVARVLEGITPKEPSWTSPEHC
jgi:hypothetical protein